MATIETTTSVFNCTDITFEFNEKYEKRFCKLIFNANDGERFKITIHFINGKIPNVNCVGLDKSFYTLAEKQVNHPIKEFHREFIELLKKEKEEYKNAT